MYLSHSIKLTVLLLNLVKNTLSSNLRSLNLNLICSDYKDLTKKCYLFILWYCDPLFGLMIIVIQEAVDKEKTGVKRNKGRNPRPHMPSSHRLLNEGQSKRWKA